MANDAHLTVHMGCTMFQSQAQDCKHAFDRIVAGVLSAAEEAARQLAGASSGTHGAGGEQVGWQGQAEGDAASEAAALLQDLQAAHQQLQAAHDAGIRDNTLHAMAALAEHARGQMRPALARLAALLHRYWQLPSQREAAQLELAQAVATRSCAYLRCANLDGGGGPGAGEGAGSMRCSGCRVAWYCGEACSHADWRAGHRCVCKAVAAARRQQQA